ncbi:MAG: F0F1 ATP synthase subunit B [Pseudomonadota bacterium]|nr:F0F1 ATP synthase subunit B [Pseudomonadota bacterium]
MNFNFTLIGQLLAFILFVWFCMRYIWPPMLRILEEREKEIADGLNAASEGKRELEEASVKKKEILKDAKEEAAELINQAGQRANQLVEDAKTSAQKEAEKIKVSAQNDLEQNTKRAREELRSEVAILAVAGAEKILNSEIDEKKNSDLIDELTKEL